ncbi:MAG: pinensin family lanthipeptide [Cyclobacteriaceae bacterium]
MKKKLKIQDLKVESFVTETSKEQIKAGQEMKRTTDSGWATPETWCFVC